MRLPSLLGLNLIYSLNRGELRAEIKTALEIPDSGFPNLGCAFSISVSIALAPKLDLSVLTKSFNLLYEWSSSKVSGVLVLVQRAIDL